ncbi:signal recognition particle subunit FFH/SRP54 (srp54) [Friedmanniella luteola]|uniref:Signal recognition particle protein n=1 Tax=Friedmanniella luteola TaxID=546871 RepID=A0A1H1QA06_9ACTN|nr:signal recognition particle protein [Friedmanniella luteola]SDS20275.1 signal recognition particle subunit FFH/SRP54 (srp54) [Friedmanniella luteola]
MFDTLQDRLAATFKNLRGKGRLTEADIDAAAREIRVALLEADVNLAVVKDFVAAVKDRARGTELSGALNPGQQVIKIVNDELVTILGGETRLLRFAKRPPTVIMLAGLQGAGKTTLAGKLALWLKSEGHSPLLVAADLQRPNAVNQLQVVGQRAGVQVFAPEPGNGAGDPVAVAKASIGEAERRLFDVVIVDTAGRLGVDADLMQQAADIRDAVSPDEILFVVDAMIGQDAVNTAKAFAEGVGFDGVVLTKLDGDARGGAALSIARVTGSPIMFASNGEQLKDFDVFHPDRMASRILGMGDMLTLIEQAEKTFDAEQSAKAAAKLTGQGGEFGLADFLQQMQMVRKMGPLSKIFGMLPGMGEIKDQINNIDERDVDRIEAIIHSMTPTERDNPKIIDGSRRARIAKGSGVEVSEVNGLVNRFFEARKMMTSMASGKMPGMPGLPGMGGPKKPPAKQQKKKGARGVSGNPAKRNALPARAGDPADAAAAFGAGGLDQAALEKAMADFQLPPELRGRLGK